MAVYKVVKDFVTLFTMLHLFFTSVYFFLFYFMDEDLDVSLYS